MSFFQLLKKTYTSWDKNDPWARSAIIAYYALFSLPSLLMITAYVAGTFYGREAVQGRITMELSNHIGIDAANAIEDIIANAALEDSSTITVIVGISMLVFGATGVFFQLQKSLNNIWSVRAKHTTILALLKRRVTSFGLVLVVGLLLLISLVISSIISALSDFLLESYQPVSNWVSVVMNFLVTELFVLSLFITIFTVLPDVKIHWRTTIFGAFVTSMLFLIGKYLLGFYFAQANPGSVYGAAGSVVLILLWVYYTCLILFFGAEFTVNWALSRSLKIVPNKNATLSYEKELIELREYKKKIEEDLENAKELASNSPL